MFRKSATAIALAISLGACSTTSMTVPDNAIIALLPKIIAFTKGACNAVPELAGLIALANQGVGVAVGSLGTAFCQFIQNAVPTSPPASTANARIAVPYARRVYVCNGAVCGWRG